MFSWSVSTATKYISSFPFPSEWVIGVSSTHTFINQQGRKVLLNDGYKKEAQFFSMFANQLDSGVVWVDHGLQSTCHLYDPDTKKECGIGPVQLKSAQNFITKL